MADELDRLLQDIDDVKEPLFEEDEPVSKVACEKHTFRVNGVRCVWCGEPALVVVYDFGPDGPVRAKTECKWCRHSEWQSYERPITPTEAAVEFAKWVIAEYDDAMDALMERGKYKREHVSRVKKGEDLTDEDIKRIQAFNERAAKAMAKVKFVSGRQPEDDEPNPYRVEQRKSNIGAVRLDNPIRPSSREYAKGRRIHILESRIPTRRFDQVYTDRYNMMFGTNEKYPLDRSS